MELKTNCRSYSVRGNDPFYASTDTWKTKRQWYSLGYQVDEYLCKLAIKRGLTWYIFGYVSGQCLQRCTRIHKRVVRLMK